MSLVLDTSAVLAFLNRSDPSHGLVKTVILEEASDLIVPMGILAEIAYLVETRLSARVFDLFLGDVEAGHFVLECGLSDIAAVRELAKRYGDLPLGYADAAVIRCAMRNEKRVASLDRRHFEVVQRELGFELLP